MKKLSLVLALLALPLMASSAFAACSSPAGNAGDIVYSSSSSIMVYCNGTSWIGMGVNATVNFGTLTSGNLCTATGTAGIACTTSALNLATQVTGNLPAADLPGLASTNIWVGNSSGVATAVTASGDCTISNTGAFTCTKSNGTAFGPLATASGTAVANNVPLWSSTTAIGTSNIYQSGSNIGIGTTAPGLLLDVSSATQYNGIRVSNGTNEVVKIYGGVTGNDAGNINLEYGGVTKVTLSSNYYSYFMGGNVGIGTTSPISLLNVSGGNLNVTNSAGTITFFGATNASNNGLIYSQNASGANAVYLNTSGNSYLNGGSVGIGTATPSAALHIYGGTERITNGASTNGYEFLDLYPTDYGATVPYLFIKPGSGGAWSIGLWNGSAVYGTLQLQAPTVSFSANATVAGQLTTTQVAETAVQVCSACTGTQTINLASGTYFYGTCTGATTWAVSNWPASGKVGSFTLELTNCGAYTMTWMTGTKWPAAAVPTLTSSGTDILVCYSRDAGTTPRCTASETNSH